MEQKHRERKTEEEKWGNMWVRAHSSKSALLFNTHGHVSSHMLSQGNIWKINILHKKEQTIFCNLNNQIGSQINQKIYMYI